MSETRCEDCENWNEQCSNCKDKDYSSGQTMCPESGDTVPANQCGCYAVHAKQDACTKCSYVFNYP